MKRKLLFLLVLCLSTYFTTFAQVKGDMSAGGQIGIGFSAADDLFSFSFQIAPEFNYFVADRCELGVSVNYAITTFMVMPSFHYFVKLTDGLYYTPGVALGGGFLTDYDAVAGAFGVQLDLFRLEFRPTQKLGFTFNACNFSYLAIPDAYYGNHIFDFGINTGSMLGVKFYF